LRRPWPARRGTDVVVISIFLIARASRNGALLNCGRISGEEKSCGATNIAMHKMRLSGQTIALSRNDTLSPELVLVAAGVYAWSSR
jgi:hypothetical protein